MNQKQDKKSTNKETRANLRAKTNVILTEGMPSEAQRAVAEGHA